MRPLGFLLVAAFSLSGCDFVHDGYVPPAARITGVVLQELPLTRSNGAPWDSDSHADVVVEIQNIGGVALARSARVTDLAALPDGGLAVDLAFDVRGERDFFLVVNDGDGDTVELMASSEAFTYADLTATPADAVSIGDGGHRLRALLRVTR